MSTIISSAPIVMLKARGGVVVSTYSNELEAVKDMLDNGSLGGLGSCYGSVMHLDALIQVEEEIANVRMAIQRFTDEDAAPAT
jgi:hypothetical protein